MRILTASSVGIFYVTKLKGKFVSKIVLSS